MKKSNLLCSVLTLFTTLLFHNPTSANLNARQKLVASNAQGATEELPSTWFGSSASTSNDWIAVGGINSGKVYIYRRENEQWSVRQVLTPVKENGSADLPSKSFGKVLDIDNNMLAVLNPSLGLLYIYGQMSESWVIQQVIQIGSGTASVSIDGEIIAVGNPAEACGSGSECGAAYIYTISQDEWKLTSRITASKQDGSSDETAYARFGQAISLHNNKLLVGAPWKSCKNGVHCGLAYLYEASNNNWKIAQELAPESIYLNGFPWDGAEFGYAVAIGESSIAIGAPKVNRGIIYLYEHDGQSFKISDNSFPDNNAPFEASYGSSISIVDDLILAGASGKATILKKQGIRWLRGPSFITLSTAPDGFGSPVNMSEKYAIIGAPQSVCDAGSSCGAAYAYTVTPRFTLATIKGGNGKITSSPPGIDCGTTCEAKYNSGVKVTLTATPDSQNSFSGWSGDCSGTSTSCTITMISSMSVRADFSEAATTKTLSVSKQGLGVVTSAPQGIECGAKCIAPFSVGANVTLTATPSDGGTFIGWSGACSGNSLTCNVTMSSSREVTAKFQDTFLLTVNRTGSGTVLSTPSGISCGNICGAAFPKGTTVALTAEPNNNYRFDHWEGACSGNTTCDIEMTSGKTVTAVFSRLANQYNVSINKTGLGTVTSSPVGISCGPTCTGVFPEDARLFLTAKPEDGYTFSGWSGACVGNTESCTLNVASSVTATASFTEVTKYFLSINKPVGGVLMDGKGLISCGGPNRQCKGEYSSISLTATPNPGYTLKKWVGCPAPTGNSCSLTLTKKTTVGAVFAKLPKYPLKITKTPYGEITTDPAGLKCKAKARSCSASFVSGTRVRLTPNPLSGYRFTGWSGACSGTAACEVTMDAKKMVGAQFE